MERTFQESAGKLLKVTDKPITKITNSQFNIKQGKFTGKELNVVLTKIKNRKAACLDEIPQGNLKAFSILQRSIFKFCDAGKRKTRGTQKGLIEKHIYTSNWNKIQVNLAKQLLVDRKLKVQWGRDYPSTRDCVTLIGELRLTLSLTCIYGEGRVHYVGSTTISRIQWKDGPKRQHPSLS